VLVAAIRYGRHLPEAERFLAIYRSLSSPPPLALASVNLVARKTVKTTVAGNPYLRKFIARHRLAPAVAVAFAGRLDYRRYGWLDRQIIRFIMLLTGARPPRTPALNLRLGPRSTSSPPGSLLFTEPLNRDLCVNDFGRAPSSMGLHSSRRRRAAFLGNSLWLSRASSLGKTPGCALHP